MTQYILSIFYILLISQYIVSTVLQIMNLNNSLTNRHSVPSFMRDSLSMKEYDKTIEYTQRKGKFTLFSLTVNTIITALIIFYQAPALFFNLITSWNLHQYLEGALFILLFSAIMSLFSLPMTLYSQFIIEEEFGFNKMTFKLFFIDMLKGTVLSLILFVPLIMGLFLFIDKTGDLWWIYAFLFFAGFQFLVSLLYPLVIAPLFNKFSPLEEGSLKDKLEALAEKTSFKTKGIFQMDGSRRSAHSNAYFTGFGRAKRIVLFDTLIKKLNDDELEAVLAHEIGHYKKKHILKSMISSLVISLGLFYLLSQLLHYDPLYQAFGFSEASPAVLLFLITILMEPISFFIKPLFSGFSRKNEYEADRYAKEITGSPNFLIKALTKLSKDNLSNLTPHKAFSAFHYSHPVLSERIAALESN